MAYRPRSAKTAYGSGIRNIRLPYIYDIPNAHQPAPHVAGGRYGSNHPHLIVFSFLAAGSGSDLGATAPVPADALGPASCLSGSALESPVCDKLLHSLHRLRCLSCSQTLLSATALFALTALFAVLTDATATALFALTALFAVLTGAFR